MSWARRATLALALVAAGCAAGEPAERETLLDFEELLRAEYPPEPVFLSYGDAAMPELSRLGWLDFRAGDWLAGRSSEVALTSAGEAVGLEVAERQVPGPWGTTYTDRFVRARACDRAFGGSSGPTEIEIDGVRAAVVHYRSGFANHTAFFRAMLETKHPPTACMPEAVERHRVLFVADEGGWRRNRPPVFADSPAPRIATSYSYDRAGRLNGAASTIHAPPATDPDGDSLVTRWSGYFFDGDSARDIELEGDARELKWSRWILMGEPAGGRVFLTALDHWGAGDTLTFCFEGAWFRC